MSSPATSTRPDAAYPSDLSPGAVLRPLFAKAIERGDGIAVAVRSVFAAALLVRVLVERLPEILAGERRPLLIAETLLASLFVPLLGRVLTRRYASIRVRATMSVLSDALTVTLVLLPLPLFPSDDYRGLLHEVEVGFFFLAVATAGLRLSRTAVLFGFLANALGLGVLIWVDHTLSPERVEIGLSSVALALIMLSGSALLAWWNASRTRQLVYDGSRATLLAERARQRLGVYVSEEIATQALEGAKLELGGSRRDVAVLFSDLRGFTTYAEKVPPERIVEELNAYLAVMVRQIRDEGGMVDKYIGDAIMAVFGLTGASEEAGARALRAAAGMNAALVAHNAERVASGKPPLKHGIGVHAGPVVAGNIGTAERMQFTVVGDVVNVASRLESATKELGVTTLLSNDAIVAAGRAPAGLEVPASRPCGTIEIRGHEVPLTVHSLDVTAPAA